MSGFEKFLSTLQKGTARREARRFLRACSEAQASKILTLQPGATTGQMEASLRTDQNLTDTILNAYPQADREVATQLSASLLAQERMRISETAKLEQIQQEFIGKAQRLRAITGASGSVHPSAQLRSNLEHSRLEASNIRRRSQVHCFGALGIFLLGLALLFGDLALMYQNFSLMLSPTGSPDSAAMLAAFVTTIIVVFLLLLLTHLGLAPLLKKALVVLQTEEDSPLISEEKSMPKIKRAALVIMLLSSLLGFVVSYCIAAIRENLSVSEGSGTTFITLNTIGLPILNLFIHICFMEAYQHWKAFTDRIGAILDATQSVRQADRELALAEIQNRKARPLARELQRIEQQHQKALKSAYQRARKHPGVKSEINRLAEILIAPTNHP